MTKLKIVVIGAGAWGTAIANTLAQKQSATLIANKDEISAEINQFHTNQKFLPNTLLTPSLKSATDLARQISDADYIFIVTPSSATPQIIEKISQLKIKNSCGFVLCTKGLHHERLKFFHEIIEENLPKKKYAILSGPNFAIEVASLVSSVTTIASKDRKFATEIINLLNNSNFKAEYCDDIITTEISGVVKNIIAIGCGISDGLNLGQNTKAAIVYRGIKEIEALSKKLGGSGNLVTAAGFGDIFLTCSTTKSRNNSLGFLIAEGKNPRELLSSEKTYEGAVGAKSITKLATELDLKLNLCGSINEILHNNFSQDKIKQIIHSAALETN